MGILYTAYAPASSPIYEHQLNVHIYMIYSIKVIKHTMKRQHFLPIKSVWNQTEYRNFWSDSCCWMSNVDRTGGAGGSNMRDRSTIRRLQMYRNFKAKRFVKLQHCAVAW